MFKISRQCECRVVCAKLMVLAFSSLARILGECSTIHSLPALFFFFFEVEISLRTRIPLFVPGSVHNGSVNKYDQNNHIQSMQVSIVAVNSAYG